MRVMFTLKAGNNALVQSPSGSALTRVHEYDSVWAVRRGRETPACTSYGATRAPGVDPHRRLRCSRAQRHPGGLPAHRLAEVQRPTVDNQGLPAFGPPTAIGEFGFDPRATGTGITTVLTANPPTHRQALTVPVAIEDADALSSIRCPPTSFRRHRDRAVRRDDPRHRPGLDDPAREPSRDSAPRGWLGRQRPGVSQYTGDPLNFTDYQNNARRSRSTGCWPSSRSTTSRSSRRRGPRPAGSEPAATATTEAQVAQEISGALITHCEKMLYRVAALDTPAQSCPMTRSTSATSAPRPTRPCTTVDHRVAPRRQHPHRRPSRGVHGRHLGPQ